jgi:hypothetical protein
MIVGILQPGYLPWLGFFEQIYKCDKFIIYDDVQYDKHGWRNRNRIKTTNGVQWLTVPVFVNFKEKPLINEIRIDNKINWRKKHLFAIKQSYSKATFFTKYINIFEDAYSREWQFLIDVDMYFIMKIAECLGLGNKRIIKSSTLNIRGDRIERLINICKKFDADTFYEGASGENYINKKYFAMHGIKVIFQEYKHLVYNQLHGNFVPFLSIVDLLFNHGEKSLEILINQSL